MFFSFFSRYRVSFSVAPHPYAIRKGFRTYATCRFLEDADRICGRLNG